MAEAPNEADTIRTAPSIMTCVAATSTSARNPQAGTAEPAEPARSGTVGPNTATAIPNAAGTMIVPGPTGARIARAASSRHAPVSTVTKLNGRPVLEEIPSSSTKRGPLPSAEPDTNR